MPKKKFQVAPTASGAPPVLRYCAQPIQHPRQFDPAVDALRTRAIINGGKKWVNGTQLTYYCYKTGDAVAAARCGKPDDIKEVQAAFNLAAPHCGGDALSELTFSSAELLGQAKTHLQEAVIHRF